MCIDLILQGFNLRILCKKLSVQIILIQLLNPGKHSVNLTGKLRNLIIALFRQSQVKLTTLNPCHDIIHSIETLHDYTHCHNTEYYKSHKNQYQYNSIRNQTAIELRKRFFHRYQMYISASQQWYILICQYHMFSIYFSIYDIRVTFCLFLYLFNSPIPWIAVTCRIIQTAIITKESAPGSIAVLIQIGEQISHIGYALYGVHLLTVCLCNYAYQSRQML